MASQHHISADISLALRSYFYATRDRDWLATQAWPVIQVRFRFVAGFVSG